MYIRCIFKLGMLVLFSALAVTLLAACDNQTKKSEPVLSTTAGSEKGSYALTDEKKQTADISSVDTFHTDKIDTYIILNDDSTTINGEGAVFEKGILTINGSGTYSLSGEMSDGKIYVNSSDEEKKVKLYLDGVTVFCEDDAPLYVENSPKETILILADGSVNTFTDSADRSVPSDGSDYATATIYSKDDLQIEGSGTLNINANFNKGIFSKNDIDVRGGTININSADDGIRGKESVDISNGDITIVSGGDGIRTSEETETDKGDIAVSGGNISITSELDGIQAVRNLTLSGGNLKITTGGGAIETQTDPGNTPGMDGGRIERGPGKRGPEKGFGKGAMMPADSSMSEETAEDTPSVKGIKATGEMKLSDCSVTVSAGDDAIHANSVEIQSGSYCLESSDDAVHADTNVKIGGGDINVPMCYEGIEGQQIDINGGKISLVCSDDGLNAVSPDSSGAESGHPMMQVDNSCQVNISGGYVHINSEGDGVDSNGNVDMTDGTVVVFGPQSGGNGALDYGGKFNVHGGTLLALGSAGMAQSVTGEDGVKVFAYNYQGQQDVLNVITDENGEVVIGFKSPKSFQTMVFAHKESETDGNYTMYQGGSIDKEGFNGVYSDGIYTPGTQVGVLS